MHTANRVFLACHRRDVERVRELAGILISEGLDTVMDVWNLDQADPWSPELEAVLDECTSCLLCFGVDRAGPWLHPVFDALLRRRVRIEGFRIITVVLAEQVRAEVGDDPAVAGITSELVVLGSGDALAEARGLLARLRSDSPSVQAVAANSPESNKSAFSRDVNFGKWVSLTRNPRVWGVVALMACLAVFGVFSNWSHAKGYSNRVAGNVILGQLGIYWFIEPDMVRIPPVEFEQKHGVDALKFTMGSDAEWAIPPIRPPHTVTLQTPFKIGKHLVTFDQYDVFVALVNLEGGCALRPGANSGKRPIEMPKDARWGRGDRPVINVSWNQINCYVAWLREKTGKPYRLPTEAESEFAARGGTKTMYWWGDEVQQDGKAWANCFGCGSEWDHKQTSPVGSFPANPFGIYDATGNVWQWVEDCRHENYNGAPQDGSAWVEQPDCLNPYRVVRGGSWNFKSHGVRTTSRNGSAPNAQFDYVGFRVAMDLPKP